MELLKIDGLKKGTFKARPNRYLSQVMIDGAIELVHVHDPGRLKELLFPENECLVKYAAGGKRKTQWDMIAAKKEDAYVLVHSGYHRYLSEAIIKHPEVSPFKDLQSYQAEVTYGESRLDYRLQTHADEEIWVEVKGCSLSVDGVARFPDAPTVRGTKHLRTLMALKNEGKRAAVLLLILSDAEVFEPNAQTDPTFAKTFYEALSLGVEVYPLQVAIDMQKGSFLYKGILPIRD